VKKSGKFNSFVVYSYLNLKKVHLQRLKGIQSSKQGLWREHLLGTFSVQNGIQKGMGLDFGAGPFRYKTLLSTPIPPGFVIHQSLATTVVL